MPTQALQNVPKLIFLDFNYTICKPWPYVPSAWSKVASTVGALFDRVARFYCCKIPKQGKIYQMTRKYFKCPQNIPNGHKIEQMALKYTNIFRCKTHQNLFKSVIFGLKKYHLATLLFDNAGMMESAHICRESILRPPLST
jgi:hypothetical protein